MDDQLPCEAVENDVYRFFTAFDSCGITFLRVAFEVLYVADGDHDINSLHVVLDLSRGSMLSLTCPLSYLALGGEARRLWKVDEP